MNISGKVEEVIPPDYEIHKEDETVKVPKKKML